MLFKEHCVKRKQVGDLHFSWLPLLTAGTMFMRVLGTQNPWTELYNRCYLDKNQFYDQRYYIQCKYFYLCNQSVLTAFIWMVRQLLVLCLQFYRISFLPFLSISQDPPAWEMGMGRCVVGQGMQRPGLTHLSFPLSTRPQPVDFHRETLYTSHVALRQKRVKRQRTW